MSNSSSFYNTVNPTPEDQPTLYQQLLAATAAAQSAGNLAKEFTVYTDTWSSSMAINWSIAMTHRVRLAGNTTFTFSNARDGEKLVLELKQDATGSRTITLPSNVRYSLYVPSVTLSTTAGYIDKLGFIYNATDDKYDLVAVAYGIH